MPKGSNFFSIFLVVFLIVVPTGTTGTPPVVPEVADFCHALATSHSDQVTLSVIGQSAGKRDIILVKIGSGKKMNPELAVIANMTGDSILGTKAALLLMDKLVGEWSARTIDYTWAIIPVANPDAYERYFQSPQYRSRSSDRALNDDNDDAVDEDGPEDLNGDGMITVMRQRHREGNYVLCHDNDLLLCRYDDSSSGKDVFRIFQEGIDNDGDGLLNEDGSGGNNPDCNFPHAFPYDDSRCGPWPASEPETRAIMSYAYGNPAIAALIVFGHNNTFFAFPAEEADTPQAERERYHLPYQISLSLGIDDEQSFTFEDLIPFARQLSGKQDLPRDQVLSVLGMDFSNGVDRRDRKWWSEITGKYHAFLKEQGLPTDKRFYSFPGPGSLESWAYHQYGVPVFALSFWRVPPAEGSEDSDGPSVLFSQTDGSKALYDPALEADCCRHDPTSILAWVPFQHPTLGAVEIGGRKPFADVVPDSDTAARVIEKNLGFLSAFPSFLPRLVVYPDDLQEVENEIWRMNVVIRNEGLISFPTAQGFKAIRPLPFIVQIHVQDGRILTGSAKQVLRLLESGDSQSLQWLIKARQGSIISLIPIMYGFSGSPIEIRVGERSKK